MNKTRYLVPLVALFFVGCAGTLSPGAKPRLAPPQDDKAIVYVLDDNSESALSPALLLMINGSEVGSIDSHKYTWFYLERGQVRISINDPLIKSRKLSATKLDVDAGKEYFLRYKVVNYKSDGQLVGDIFSGASRHSDDFDSENLQLLTEQEAKTLLSTFTLVGNKIN